MLNKPPQVIWPEESVNLLPVVSDPTIVTVVAHDPDDDRLTFLWVVPGATEIPVPEERQTRTLDWESYLLIPQDWLQDGAVIKVTISDEAEPPNLVRVQWQVEVAP